MPSIRLPALFAAGPNLRSRSLAAPCELLTTPSRLPDTFDSSLFRSLASPVKVNFTSPPLIAISPPACLVAC